MKDRVQKILSEIATRKLCTMDEHMAFYNDTAKEDYRFLSEIEELIKALQEEPVSELWHDSNKEQPKAESDVAIWDGERGEILTRCVKVNPNRKWAYMEDLLNKKEEPVSEDLEEASQKYASNNTPWDDCVNEMQESFKAGAQWQKQKEINEIRAEIKKRYEHHLGCMEGSRDDTYPEISHAHHCAIKTELFEILCFLDGVEGKSDVSEANFGKISKD